ncbi:hypothetical protein LguiA_001466 [Lonicera macranthoides]
MMSLLTTIITIFYAFDFLPEAFALFTTACPNSQWQWFNQIYLNTNLSNASS